MNVDELLVYLEDNSTALTTFKEKAVAYQEELNQERLMAQRWSEEMVERAAEKMVQEYVEKIYLMLDQKITTSGNQPANVWREFIQNQNIIEQLEESVTEIEFE